jgi:hypothetical protein
MRLWFDTTALGSGFGADDEAAVVIQDAGEVKAIMIWRGRCGFSEVLWQFAQRKYSGQLAQPKWRPLVVSPHFEQGGEGKSVASEYNE